MKKTTYTKKSDKLDKKTKKKKELEKLENEELELTNVYKYTGSKRTKAKLKNNARVAKYEAGRLKLKYKKGGIGQKLLIIFMFILIIGLTLGITFTLYIILNSPKFDTSNLYSKESSVLLDKNGNEFARLGTENRELVTYDDLPQVLVDAIVATEDSRYFQHNGVDIARFTKAVIGQLMGNSNAGGGSTLTMQVVKNTYTSTEASGIQGIIRKFTDIYMSVFKVEKRYTKEEIIEFYVNIPYLGSGSYGVEQASQKYFGKSTSELSLPEAAIIAGLFQAPDAYDPYSRPKLAEERKNIVLSLMKRHGYISDKEYQLAKSINIEELLVGSSSSLNKYQGFVDTVVAEVIDRTGNDPATTSMVIHTTLDPERQDVIENLYKGETYTWVNDVVQAGIAVIDVKDGSITAVGAGRNKKSERSYNYATMINRHPGSTAKPIFDYGPAIEYLGWSTGETVIDDKYTYSGGGSIKNHDNGYKGVMTAIDALAQSRNIPALYAFQQVDQKDLKEFVTNLGIKPEIENGYIHESHSIGGFNGVNPVQMAAAYATFARGGTYIEPYSVTKIEYANSGETYTVKPEKRKAMSDSTAYMINHMLRYAVTSGNISTGTVSGTDVASKTGTSTVDSAVKKEKGITRSIIGDSWQMSYSPDYSIALWYGYDEITKEYNLTTSEGNAARRSISKVLGSKIFKTGSRFKQPTSVVSAEIELGTDPLQLASANTPDDLRKSFLFKKGTTPSETSSRFATLENVKNAKYTLSNGNILISWDKISNPAAIDQDAIKDYFNNNIYKRWVDTYLNERLVYNNTYIGEVVYNIYINGQYVGNTTSNSYTYQGTITDNATITIKTSYSKYARCESEGVKLVFDGDAIINPPIDNPTPPSDNDDGTVTGNKNFIVDFLEDRSMTRAKFNSIQNNLINYTIITDTTTNEIITDKCFINYNCSDTNCALDEFTATLTIKCDGYTDSKNLTLRIGG